MRYARPVTEDLVPEWKSCYYNYKTLDDLVDVLQKLQTIHSKIRQNELLTYQRINIVESRRMAAQRDILELIREIKICDQNIRLFRDVELSVIYVFANYKMGQLRSKFRIYKLIISPFAVADENSLTLIENIYAEFLFLQKLIVHCLNLDERIVKNMTQASKKYNEISQIQRGRKIQRIYNCLKFGKDRVEEYYIEKKKIKRNDNYIENQVKKKRLNEELSYEDRLVNKDFASNGFIFGLAAYLMGTFCILSIKYEFFSNDKFMVFFPAWRGLIPFIVYLYVLGIDISIFEYKQINYKRIMRFGQHNIPNSISIIRAAVIITNIYLFLFILFGLTTVGLIEGVKPQVFIQIIYLVWAVFLFFPVTISKFDKHLSARDFTQQIILKMFASCFIKVDYCSNWLSQQLTSFKLAFQDLSNAILLLLYGNRSSNADNALLIGAVIGSSMFAIRIFQATNRIIREQACGFQKPYIFGIIKCSLGIATIWFSYVSRIKQNDTDGPQFFYAWIFVACVSTLYAYVFDLRFDWDLYKLQECRGGCPVTLRKTKIYANYTYVIIAVINFLLRIAWSLNISTDLLQRFFQQSEYIVVTVFSAVEICRRGLWNLIFIEKDHVKSVQALQAIANNSELQGKAITRYKKMASDKKVQQFEKIWARYEKEKKYFEEQKNNVKNKIKASLVNQKIGREYIEKINKKYIDQLEKKYGFYMNKRL